MQVLKDHFAKGIEQQAKFLRQDSLELPDKQQRQLQLQSELQYLQEQLPMTSHHDTLALKYYSPNKVYTVCIIQNKHNTLQHNVTQTRHTNI